MVEGISKRKLEGFCHITLAGVLRADIVAEVGILKSAAKNLTQVDRADDSASCCQANEKADRIFSVRPVEKGCELFRRGWRRDQTAMKARACTVKRNELRPIAAGG